MMAAFSMLGLRKVDRVTGFAGTVTSVSFDLYGCIAGLLTAPLVDHSKDPEQRWFDVKRLDDPASGESRVMDPPRFALDLGPEPGGISDKPIPA